jgi:hypothetical protein
MGRSTDMTISRTPQWREVSTFPKHFHNGSQNRVQESKINDDPAIGVREFMDFIRRILK